MSIFENIHDINHDITHLSNIFTVGKWNLHVTHHLAYSQSYCAFSALYEPQDSDQEQLGAEVAVDEPHEKIIFFIDFEGHYALLVPQCISSL